MNAVILWAIELCNWYVNRRSSETTVHMRTTWLYIPEDGNNRNYRFENLKSCNKQLNFRVLIIGLCILLRLYQPIYAVNIHGN
jgi:hypothetical protein